MNKMIKRIVLVIGITVAMVGAYFVQPAAANDPSLTFRAFQTCLVINPPNYTVVDWGAVRRSIDPNRWEITACRFTPNISPNYGPLCGGMWGNNATGQVIFTGYAAYDPSNPAVTCPPIEGGSSF